MEYLIVLGLALAAGLVLGRVTAPKAKVVHHNHRDEKAIFEAYLKGLHDGIKLVYEAIAARIRLQVHPRDRKVISILDPRQTAIVGEVHISKKCNYNIEWFDTQEVEVQTDRPSNVPDTFIRVWDPDAQEYTWRAPVRKATQEVHYDQSA